MLKGMNKMQRLINVIKLVADKYLDKVNVILNKDMLSLEYLYNINDETDVYKIIQVTEYNKDKLKIKTYPGNETRIITFKELEELFTTIQNEIENNKNSRA